jgi:hypothetical protein
MSDKSRVVRVHWNFYEDIERWQNELEEFFNEPFNSTRTTEMMSKILNKPPVFIEQKKKLHTFGKKRAVIDES